MSLFLSLHVEILAQIAQYDYRIWFDFVIYDERFCKYAYSAEGIDQCIRAFTTFDHGTRLFGKLHSFHDIPAIDDDWIGIWYYGGLVHRDTLPAITGRSIEWLQNDIYDRPDNLPQIIMPDIRIWVSPGCKYKPDYHNEAFRIENIDNTWEITIKGEVLWYDGEWTDNSADPINPEDYGLDANYDPSLDPGWLHDIDLLKEKFRGDWDI